MSWKKTLAAILGIILFLLLTWLIPHSKRTSPYVNYAPDGFKKTINAGIKGIVSATKQDGLFWVTVEDKKLPFSYDAYKLPKARRDSYPGNFIQIGDSIYKNANSDTFYIARDKQRWQYFLPE